MPTVRERAGRVAELFLDDARSSGIDLGDLSLYFSTDPPLSRDMPRIGPEYASELRSVRHVDGDRRAALAHDLAARCALDPRILRRAIGDRSYAAARNAALACAVADGNDVAVFVDDDIYPLAPVETADRAGVEWRRTDFVRTHLARLGAGADITRGGYLGYSAPLVDLSTVLPEHCREALGLALSLGNEVLPPGCLTDPSAACMVAQPWPKSTGKGLVVYGGNVGISLSALSAGRVPAFFCTPGARGEDTFFGVLLPGAARVESAPALVFHDPFHRYPGLLGDRFPGSLDGAAEPTAGNLRRFAGAFRGWVRYAPLWIRTQFDPPGRVRTLRAIEAIYSNHRSCLATLGLDDVPRIFRLAVLAADAEFQLLHEVDVAWRTRLMPLLGGRPGGVS